MPDIQGTTRAQTLFLRAFRKSPTGPPADQWPSIADLRRWLRKPGFRAALRSLQETLHFHADFHLAMRAAHAAQNLGTQDSGLSIQDLTHLLRLSHLRQRFPTQPGSVESARREAIETARDEKSLQERMEATDQIIHKLRSARHP